MAIDPSSHLQMFVRKLESVSKFSDEERRAVLTLPVQEQDLGADQAIVREGDSPTRCCVILRGMACTYKVTGQGNRQIMAFHIAGDMPDVQSLHLKFLDVSLSTLSASRVGFIRHDVMRDLCARFPRIGSALWRDTLVDASIFREWMTNIGRRDAPAPIAHMLCEVVVKFRSVGLADGNVVEFPVTQSEIGDAMGLSAVHVNRSLMVLRRAGLISLKDGILTVLDWQNLKQTGDFDPSYLHLEDEAAAAA